MPDRSPSLVPPALVEQVLAGNCIAFVGAGFSAAARLPSWTALLSSIAAAPSVSDELREHVARLCATPSAHRLDQAAQLLQDTLGRTKFVAGVRKALGRPTMTPQMMERLRWLRGIPFRAVLTLNFDPLLEGTPPSSTAYREILRTSSNYFWNQAFNDSQLGSRVLKLHGDLEHSSAESIVITRQDYRRRLYSDPAYLGFLRSVFANYSVLFLGVSFEDAYLNELRSETLALLGYHRGQRPIAWAVLNDCDSATQAFYEAHEGIEVLSYDTAGCTDFSGFDRYLEDLHDATHPVPCLSRLLAGRSILWLDPHPDNNERGLAFLRRAAEYGGDRPDRFRQVETLEAAIEALQPNDDGSSPYQLVITHWGRDRDPPTAVALLERMRADDLRCPVIVFSTMRPARERKPIALGLGAQAYCFHWESLFREIERVLAPGDRTG